MSVCVYVCMCKTPSYSGTTYCVSPTTRCDPTVWNNRPATSETENSTMHVSINNCFFPPARTAAPCDGLDIFEKCGSLSIMVGLTSQCWVPPVIQADTLCGVQTHMMKARVIFPAAWATEMRLKRYTRTLLRGIPSVYSTIGKSLMEVSVPGKKIR